MAAEQEPQDIPGVTRPYTLLEAVAEVRRRYTIDGKVDPISANPAELPGGGIVYWNPATNRAEVYAYSADAIKKSQQSSGPVISTGLTGGAEIIETPSPPPNNQN